LGIPLDTSLFWYFYSLTRYNKVVYSGIGLSLHHHHSQEYIDATFKSSWRGSLATSFLVNMHVEPQWANRHMLPPLVIDKRGEPKMTPRLTTLVKHVVELHDIGLRGCHCVEEFTHRRIHPLGRLDKLAYECPWLADPSHEPAYGKIFILFFLLLLICYSDLMISFFDTALTQAEIDRLVAHLFDKDLPTLLPTSVPAPFSSENPPPMVRVFAFLMLFIFIA
jgi:hypothetical protein